MPYSRSALSASDRIGSGASSSSKLFAADLTIMWLVASNATAGMVISRLAPHCGSSMPFVSVGCACRALPASDTNENTTSMAHGYACPR